MRRALGLIAVAVALVATATPAPADTFRVRASGSPGNWSWQPATTHVAKGDRVVWKNPTTTTHHLVAYGGNWSYSASIASGERTGKRFRRRGTFRFRCGQPYHSEIVNGTCQGMCGQVMVM